MPRSSAEPSLADPASQSSLQLVASELDLGRARTRVVVDPPASEPAAATPLVAAEPPEQPTRRLSTAARKRELRGRRRLRRRIQAARVQARWSKVSPYVATQLSILGIAVALAEWFELHGGQPLLCRFIAALGTSLLTAPLWLLYLRRQQIRSR